jgi:hypothetical protein
MAEKRDFELDDAARQLLLDQTKAEARQKIAQARKAAAGASLPDLAVTVPEETLDVGAQGSVIAQLVGYRQLDALADRIAQTIRNDWAGVTGARILITTQPEHTTRCANHLAVTARLRVLTDRLRDADEELATADDRAGDLPAEPDLSGLMDVLHLKGVSAAFAVGPAVVAAAPVVAAGVTALAGLASTALQALRTNVTVRPVAFTLSDTAVAAAVARSLQQIDGKVTILGTGPIPANDVTRGLDELLELRDQLEDRLRTFRLTALTSEAGRLARDTARLELLRAELDSQLGKDRGPNAALRETVEALVDDVARVQALLDEQRASAARAEAVLETTDAFLAAALQPDATGLSPAAAAALFHDACGADGGLHVLFVQASAAGGESVYEERWGGDKALHMGGMAVTWMLTAPDGTLRSSGVLTDVGFASSEVGKRFEWRSS